MKDNDTKHVQTSTRALSAERFIRTFKDNVYRRLDGIKQGKSDWVKHVQKCEISIITQNIATKTIPLDAAKKENHLCVNWHLQNNAKNTRNTLSLMRAICLELIF